MLLVGQHERHPACKKLSGEMLAWLCLGQDANLHMAQLMPLPLTISCSSKFRLVLPFWCRLTQVIPDKIREGRKTSVCVFLRTAVTIQCHREFPSRKLHKVPENSWWFHSIYMGSQSQPPLNEAFDKLQTIQRWSAISRVTLNFDLSKIPFVHF